MFTNLDHRRLERSEIPSAQARTLLFVVGDVLKMLDARCLTEKETHFSNAWA
jgi:hypothetical protein